MRVEIKKWGNSLGLRLPQELTIQTDISSGQDFEILVGDDRLTIRAVPQRYKLEDLLTNVTPSAMAEAFSWGQSVGREFVDG